MTIAVGDPTAIFTGGVWEDLDLPIAPTAPSITATVGGDTTIAVTVDASSASDVVYLRYRIANGAWSAQSATFSRTGDGNITLTGLTNGQRYEIVAYALLGTIQSAWSQPAYDIPTAGDGDLVLLAEAVKDELVAGGWDATFTAERSYLELVRSKDASTLQVIVSPAMDEAAVEDVVHDDLHRKIEIAVVQKVTTAAQADTLVELEQDIYTHFRRLTLQGHWCDEIKIAPVYDRQQMFEENVFFGLMTLTYRKVA